MPAWTIEAKARARPVMSDANRAEKSRDRPGASSFSDNSAATIPPIGVKNAWPYRRHASRTAAPSLRAVISSTGVPVARTLLNQALNAASSIPNA